MDILHDPTTSQYPNRQPYFSNKFTRALITNSVASVIGRDALLLVLIIANYEDATRYSGPAKLWNGQLMAALGFKSPKQLNNARDAAIKAGYLNYHRENDRAIGKYFVCLPDEISIPQTERKTECKTEHDTESIPQTERKAEQESECKTEHETESLLSYSLIPKPKKSAGFAAEASPLPPVLNSQEFRKAWADWVRHRREIKKPLTRTQTVKQLEKFAELGQHKSIAMIAHTISQGWQGLREPEGGSARGTTEFRPIRPPRRKEAVS